MSALKRFAHNVAMSIGRKLTVFLPDRIPVTFVGVDATRELAESIAHSRNQKVLIVTDAMLLEIGLIGRVSESLETAGLRWSIYSGVEPDPTNDHVQAGLAKLLAEGCDSVLAVGGGSPMDTAKMIAALATNPVPLSKLEGAMKVRRPTLPLYAIPTTAGTGSEVTIAAVISDPSSHAKAFFVDPKLLPAMVALDPSLMLGLPPAITAATGMDALTHAIESSLSKTATPTTQGYSAIAVGLIFDHLATAVSDGGNIEARKAMALASYYAGLAFSRTGVGYVHAIAHTFGAYYMTPHGLANAIALPQVLEYSRDAATTQLATFAELIDLDGGSASDKAQKFIDAVRALMTKINIPFALADLKPGDIPAIAKQALAEAHLNYPVPRYMNQNDCEQLLGRLVV